MVSKAEIEKRIATFGDPKSNGKWSAFVARNKRYEAEQKDAELKKLVKFGVENSSNSVSKAPQGSTQHKKDILNYVNKVVADNEPKIADQEIFKNNINRKEPVALKFATPHQVGQLAQRLEENRQRTGEMSTWDMMKATAKTPQEKKEIRDIIKEDYKKHGAKDMADADLRWIGKSKYAPIADFKIDAEGISRSINNYINATRNVPVAPPKKQRDPDLNRGLASIIGETYEH